MQSENLNSSARDAVESLAQTLHEAGREAVEKNLLVRTDVPVRSFVEWNDLPEGAREGRRVQARFLLDRFEMVPKPVVISMEEAYEMKLSHERHKRINAEIDRDAAQQRQRDLESEIHLLRR